MVKKLAANLCIVRHGQSEWNKLNQFTGWVNSPLNDQGEFEARRAGKLLLDHHHEFDIVYTSYLSRAIKTATLMLEEMRQDHLPVIKAWQLNERHYGGLQGQNKQEAADLHGKEKVLQWRRSYRTRPPQVEKDSLVDEANRYRDLSIELPRGESLADVYDRVIPYYCEEIVPKLEAGKRILIAAHGNSLRALIKYLEDYDEEQIIKVELPTGYPNLYWLDKNSRSSEPYHHREADEKLEILNRFA